MTQDEEKCIKTTNNRYICKCISSEHINLPLILGVFIDIEYIMNDYIGSEYNPTSDINMAQIFEDRDIAIMEGNYRNFTMKFEDYFEVIPVEISIKAISKPNKLSKETEILKQKTLEADEYCYPEAFYFAFPDNELRDECCFTLLTKWEFEEDDISDEYYNSYFRVKLPLSFDSPEFIDGFYYVEGHTKESVKCELEKIGMTENKDILKMTNY